MQSLSSLRGSSVLSSLLLPLLILLPQHRVRAQDTNCASPPAGLAAWWRAEGDLLDSAGGNVGANGGATTFAAGEVGQAFAFDGTPASYIEVPSSPSLEIQDELTIEFWVKRLRLTYPAYPYADYVVEKGGDWSGNQVNYSAALHNSSYNYCLHFVCGGGWRGAGSIADTNNWHHCAIVARNGDTDPTFYIDGVPQPVIYREGSSVMNFVVSNRPLHIGAMIDPVTGWTYYSQTLVDELSIYHRALSATEILAIYNAGAAGKCFVPQPPTILAQPVGVLADAGTDVGFSVTAAGSPLMSFQWFFNSNALIGATGPTLVLTNTSPADAGTYFVVVTNIYGSAISSNANLTVLTHAPTITQQPQGANVYVGGSATLRAVVSGSPVLVYQWQKEGVPITEASGSSYLIVNAQLTNSGAYTLAVANPYGAVTSLVATVTVREPPPCVPASAGLLSWWRGENNALDAMGVNDGAPVPPATYIAGKVGQCFYRSTILVPDSSSLRFTNGLTLHAWVNARDFLGSPRVLMAKYDYPFTQPPGNQSSFYLGVTNNGQLYFAVSSNGVPRASAFVTTTPAIFGGIWTFVAATYDGSALRLYVNGVLESSTNYSGGIFPGTDNLGIGAGTAGNSFPSGYWPFSGLIDEVCVYNRALTADEILAVYNSDVTGFCTTPPTIVSQPQDQAIPLHEDVKFELTVQGTRPFKYQWYHGTLPIQNGTNAALVIEKVQSTSAGVYSVVISNALGRVQSAGATLSLLPPPDCTNAPPGMVSWWPAEGTGRDVVSGNNASTFSGAVYAIGKVGEAFSIPPTFNPPIAARIQVPNSPSLNFTGDLSIEAWVKAFPLNVGLYQSRLVPPPSMIIVQKRSSTLSPSAGYALTLEQGRLAFWLAANQPRTNPPAFISSGPDLRDGMFHHVAVTLQRDSVTGGRLYVDGQVVLTFDPTPQRGTLANAFPLLICSATEPLPDVALRGMVDELTIYNRALQGEEIMAIRTAGASGKCKVPPVIVQQPLTVHVLQGGSAAFTVVADGTPNLHYQWRFNNQVILGATNSSLTGIPAQPARAGTYSVLVTNGFGGVVSSNALLSLNHAPVAHCTDVIVAAGVNCLGNASIDAGSSDPDGDPITVVQSPPSPYPLGTNIVTLTVTDSWGATNSCVASVIVLDQTPPALACANIAGTNDLNACGAVVHFPLPSVTDSCSPIVNITCVPPPGSFFQVGTTPVQCQATDAAGNTGTCSFTVTVRDTQKPEITCPADITVTNAHNTWSTIVHFTPTVSDNCSGAGLPICNPASGSAFAPGRTTVTCSAIDASGNSSQCTFHVAVLPGNVPPVPIIAVSPLATFPGNTNQYVIAPRSEATVTLDGSGSYDVDDSTFLYSWSEEGVVFSTNVTAAVDLPIGTHTITLSLDDGFPYGTNSASVTLEVISPGQAVELLIDVVDRSSPHRNRQPLLATLLAASAAFERGNLNTGLNLLRTFENKVATQVTPFDPTLGNQLIETAELIRRAITAGRH